MDSESWSKSHLCGDGWCGFTVATISINFINDVVNASFHYQSVAYPHNLQSNLWQILFLLVQLECHGWVEVVGMVTAIHWSLHCFFNAFEFNKVILAKWRKATACLWLTSPRFICSSSILPFLASRSAACWGDLTCNMLEVTKMRSGEEESSVLLGCLPWHSVVWAAGTSSPCSQVTSLVSLHFTAQQDTRWVRVAERLQRLIKHKHVKRTHM